MPVITGKMSAEEFLSLPEDPDRVRSELVHGEIVMSPSPTVDHGWVVTQLTIILGTHIESHKLGQLFGDIDTYFGPDEVRRPDLLFFSNTRLHLVGASHLEGPPDLCIEILSPSNSRFDRVDKFKLYQQAGVSFYWIIDPTEKTCEAYSLVDGLYTNAGRGQDSESVRFAPFPDLEIPLARLWRPPSVARP